MNDRARAVIETQRRRRDLVRRYKASKGCSECGEGNPLCLDLHHVVDDKNPRLKTRFNPKTGSTWSPGWGNMGYERIVEEVAKCIVICSNCHRKLERKHDPPPPLEKHSPALRAAEIALGLA